MTSSSQPDDDARFAEIVAQLRDETWPESESSDPDSADSDFDAQAAADQAPPPEPVNPLAALPQQWRTPAAGQASILDEQEFEPPELAPLPAGDLGFWGALIGLVGGPLWLLYLFFFDRYARGIWWVLACALSLGGLALLVMRQPASRDDNWDDDVDGAVL